MPKMQVVRCRYLGKLENGAETWVLAIADSKLYIAMRKGHIPRADLDHMDPSTWTDPLTCKAPREVDLNTVYPPHDQLSQQASLREGECLQDFYMKRVQYLDVALKEKPTALS